MLRREHTSSAWAHVPGDSDATRRMLAGSGLAGPWSMEEVGPMSDSNRPNARCSASGYPSSQRTPAQVELQTIPEDGVPTSGP